ncbi:MAG: glycosyltransferase family 2 protein [Vicinamibacterales bacterium]
MPPILSVVMPVYNEAALVSGVVEDWIKELERLHIDYELIVYDDGSSDGTPGILARLAARHGAVVVRRHANRGHGPTILRGYREATADWVFQVDGDGEMEMAAFRALWQRREDYDFLLGRRVHRASPLTRRLITAVSRVSVRLAFGPGIVDVNAPYRLMRAARLQELLPLIPDDTFAPNVMLSGLAVLSGLRVFETPVRCVPRRTGSGSLGRARALHAAARSLVQTLRVAVRARRASRS